MTPSGPCPTGVDAQAEAAYRVPREPLLQLFLRFLRFGALAWGGPVAQIAMIRQALVDEDRWISSAQFNRVLAVYQVLPGPEAHELCVYFGMRSRGLMTVALRVMGNLVTPEDTDTVARLWRTAGRTSLRFDDRPPFS